MMTPPPTKELIHSQIAGLEIQLEHFESCMNKLAIQYEKGYDFQESILDSALVTSDFKAELKEVLETIECARVALNETMSNKKSRLENLKLKRKELSINDKFLGSLKPGDIIESTLSGYVGRFVSILELKDGMTPVVRVSIGGEIRIWAGSNVALVRKTESQTDR